MSKLEIGLARARARRASLYSVDSSVDPAQREPERDAEQSDALDLGALTSVRLDPRVLARNRIVTDETTGASDAYKMLRTRVLQRMRDNGWRTLAVTGTSPEEGKSLTAINLSIILARDVGTSVVLADMDLRKPAVHRHLGIRAKSGIGDCLRGVAALEDVALRTEADRLGLLLNERRFSNSSEMLASPQTRRLVDRISRGDGRLAVFDMPPVLASDDVLAFSPHVDAVLLVVAQGRTRHADMAAARDLLQGVNVLGVVLNRSSERVAPYYYYGAR